MNRSKLDIGLFIPCYIELFYPQVGVATLELLEKLGLKVSYPLKQTCCGQPLANSGDEKGAKKIYRNFVNNFKGYDMIVSPSGSCVYHVREHYDILEQTEDVKKVRESTFELCEFLVDIIGVKNLNAVFPHRVGIHRSCHGLRGLKLGKSSELVGEKYCKVTSLLEHVEGLEICEPERNDECCGFGGVFSVYEPDVSAKMGEARILDHEKNEVEFITANDMSCLMHMEGIIRRQKKKLRVIHVAEILNSSKE